MYIVHVIQRLNCPSSFLSILMTLKGATFHWARLLGFKPKSFKPPQILHWSTLQPIRCNHSAQVPSPKAWTSPFTMQQLENPAPPMLFVNVIAWRSSVLLICGRIRRSLWPHSCLWRHMWESIAWYMPRGTVQSCTIVHRQMSASACTAIHRMLRGPMCGIGSVGGRKHAGGKAVAAVCTAVVAEGYCSNGRAGVCTMEGRCMQEIFPFQNVLDDEQNKCWIGFQPQGPGDYCVYLCILQLCTNIDP